MAISVTGWLLARRQAVQPANANLAASTWGGIMGQMQQQLETRDAKILILETEGSQLRAEVNTLRNEVKSGKSKPPNYKPRWKSLRVNLVITNGV